MSQDATTAATIASYDLVADDYDARSANPMPSYVDFRDRFAGLLPAAGRIVDLGCGPGRDAVSFASVGHQVIGLDLTQAMLRIARSRGVRAVRGDLRRPPFTVGRLDGIWSSASLLHVPRDQVPATLRAWHALLRRDGLLGLSTSLGDGEGWEVVPYAAPGRRDPRPLRRWFVHHEADRLLDILRRSGFDVLSIERRESHRSWLMVLARAA